MPNSSSVARGVDATAPNQVREYGAAYRVTIAGEHAGWVTRQALPGRVEWSGFDPGGILLKPRAISRALALGAVESAAASVARAHRTRVAELRSELELELGEFLDNLDTEA